MAKNNDLLAKDELDKEAQALAAEILRQDKQRRIKNVEVKIKKTVKTEKGGSKKPGEKAKREQEKADGKADERGGGEEFGQRPAGEEKPEAENQTEAGQGPEEEKTGEEKPEPGEEGRAEPGEKKPKEEEEEEDEAGEKDEGQEEEKGKETGSEAEQGAGGEREKPGQGEWQAGGRTDKAGQDLDSRLLNPEQENEAAEELRQKKKSGEGREGEGEAGAETGAEAAKEGEPRSLRERVSRARQALNLKEMAKRKLEATVTAPAKQGLNQLLKQAWLNLIDSFGLTLIWINLHVFLKWVLGEKLFCKLGEEWLPKQITEAGGGAAETAGRGIGLIEVMVLLILDLIVLFVILLILALIVMIVDFMQAGVWEKIEMTIGYLTGLSWGGIKALYDLFAK